jgi:hypothetical protein
VIGYDEFTQQQQSSERGREVVSGEPKTVTFIQVGSAIVTNFLADAVVY